MCLILQQLQVLPGAGKTLRLSFLPVEPAGSTKRPGHLKDSLMKENQISRHQLGTKATTLPGSLYQASSLQRYPVYELTFSCHV